MMTEVNAAVDLSTVYYILGFFIISNIGVVVTIIIALVKGVYQFATVASKTDALHKRVDRIESTIEKLLSKDD